MINKLTVVKCALFVFIFLLAPASIRDYSIDSKTPFNELIYKDYLEKEPKYVFIGNSMLNTRIDINKLNSLTNEANFLFNYSGSLPAEWYLMMKNFVAEISHKPKAVFIFFRAQDITLADANFEFNQKIREELWRKNKTETTLNNIIAMNRMGNFKDKLDFYLKDIYPVIKLRKQFDNYFPMIAEKISNHINGKDNLINSKLVNDTFHLDNYKTTKSPIKNATEKIDKYDFNKLLPFSFLPEILKLGKQHDIKIVLIKVQDKAPTLPYFKKDNQGEANYIFALNEYCDRTKLCSLYDFTGHPLITPEMYSYTSHIGADYRTKYTEIFFNEILINHFKELSK